MGLKWRVLPRNTEPAPGQLKALKELADEQGAVYRELLGASFSHQGWIDLLFLQDNDESALLFLAEDKREAARRVLDEAGLRDREMELHSRQGGYSSEAQKKLFEEKLELLAQVLAPEFDLANMPASVEFRYGIPGAETDGETADY